MRIGSVAGPSCGNALGRGRDREHPRRAIAIGGRAPLAALGAIVLLGTLAAVVLLAAHAAADRVPHAPIIIDGDAGFTPANGVVGGTGTASDPYIIEEYTINVNFNSGVDIESTSRYYVLRNITVLGQGRWGSNGIYLYNSTNGLVRGIVVNATYTAIRVESSGKLLIDNCTASNGDAGVYLDACTDVVVRNVATTGFTYGLSARNCDTCEMDRCSSSGNSASGILLDVSTQRFRLEGCNATSSRIGIQLQTTWRCEIVDCVAKGNRYVDVSLSQADRTTIDGNALGKGALIVDGYFEDQEVPDTNTVDGVPLRYLMYADDLTLDADVGQVYLVRCDNVTVANLTFDGISFPVFIYASKHCVITGCTMTGALEGVLVREGGPIDIEGCRIGPGTGGYDLEYGISIMDGEVNVTDTEVSGSPNGIMLDGLETARIHNCTVSRSSNCCIMALPSTDAPSVGGRLEVEGCTLLDGGGDGISSLVWALEVRGTRIDNMTLRGIVMDRVTGPVVDGCNITRCPIAVRFITCKQIVVSSNVIAGSGASSTGIRLEGSSGTVRDNNVTRCVPAISLAQSSNDCSLLRNSVTGVGPGGQPGISVASSVRAVISGCEVYGFENGIRLAMSGSSEVTRCLVANCTVGIMVVMSSDTMIKECTVRGCPQLGIRVLYSQYCDIHHNNLMLNNFNPASGLYMGRQAWDDSGSTWDDAADGIAEGNYWADYQQWYPDANPNGKVWDTPYVTNGSRPGTDRYPLTLLYDFRPPVAAAGDDVTVGENTTVAFDGSGSSDDIGVSGYVWRFTYEGLPVSLTGPVVQYKFGPLGTYEVTLTVRDAWGNTGSDKVVVRVVDMVPPVAVAGDDMTVNVDERFVLDGTGSFDDHGVASYLWTIDPAGLNITSRLPLLVLSFPKVGDYWADLNVSDEAGNTANDSLLVHVRDLTSPVAEAGPDIDIGQGEAAHLNASGSTDNVGIVRWNWTFMYNATEFALPTENASFVFDVPGTYNVLLTVWDAAGRWSQDVLWVRVRDTEPPVAEAGPDIWADQQEVVTLSAAGSRDNVAIVTYTWHITIDGEERSFMGAKVDVMFLKAGDYPVSLNVTDGSGNWARDSMVVHVADVTPPTASAGPDVTVNQHTEVAFDGRNSEDDVGVVSYRWSLVDGGVAFTFDTPEGAHTFDAVGTYNVTLTVADAAGNSASDSFTVTVKDIEPPAAVSGGNRTAIEGTTVTLDASASHDNVGIAIFRWAVVTPNGTVYHSGAVYSFKVEGAHDLKVELRVEDAAGNAAIDDLIITVLPLYVTLRLGPFEDQDGKAVEGAGVTVTLNGTAYTGTTDRLGYVELLVNRFDLVSPLGLVATKPGYERLFADIPLDPLGRPTEDVPTMMRIPELGLENPLIFVLLVAIIAIVLGGVVYAIYRTSRSRREGPEK